MAYKSMLNSLMHITNAFQLNTSLDGIVTNLVHGEHCARYQVRSMLELVLCSNYDIFEQIIFFNSKF